MSIHARLGPDTAQALCGARQKAIVLPGENHSTTCPQCRKIIASDVAKRINPPRPKGIAFHRDAFSRASAGLPMPAPLDTDDEL